MSIEALAMAGADYSKCDINLEELERRDSEKPPQYLLAELRTSNHGSNGETKGTTDDLMREKWQVKSEKMEAWATSYHYLSN